ncbi:MAG: hypothetical protein KC620_01355, partial [Myxococcales bacterium]|nr:hypothetical protein [Myxococcales bacterium]
SDDDCDGRIDEGCAEACGMGVSRACFPAAPAQIGVGTCRAGVQRCQPDFMWGPCEGAVLPAAERCDGVDHDCDGRADEGCMMCAADEICGNGLDDDCDGAIDDGCGECAPGAMEACPGSPRDGVGACRAGSRTCDPDGHFGPCEGAVRPGIDVCGNGVDEDCDGADAECGPVEVPIFLLGDCLTAACPPATPYPVGCQVFFSPGDNRGCVASRPDNPVVYFQAGDACTRGFVTGILRCAEEQGDPLNFFNCPINKPIPLYPPDRSGCPEVHD